MPQLKVDDLAELPLFYAYCLATGWRPVETKGRHREVVEHSGLKPITYISHRDNPRSAITLSQFHDRSYHAGAFWEKMCETGFFPVKLPDCQATGEPQFSIEIGEFEVLGNNALDVFKKAVVKFENKSEIVDIPDCIWSKYQELLRQREEHRAYLEECRRKAESNDLSP